MGTQILYKFYSKAVTNPLNILRRSAMPEGLKVATTSQEILRRLKTSGEYLPKETTEEILKKYMDNLSAMGYSHAWKKKVLRTTMIGYMRVLMKSRKGETSRNRKGKDTQVSRRFKKLLGN